MVRPSCLHDLHVYRLTERFTAQFEIFLVKHWLIKAGALFATNPGTHSAHFNVLWIMNQ